MQQQVRNRFRMEEIRLYDSPFKELADQVADHCSHKRSFNISSQMSALIRNLSFQVGHTFDLAYLLFRVPHLLSYFLLRAGEIKRPDISSHVASHATCDFLSLLGHWLIVSIKKRDILKFTLGKLTAHSRKYLET